MEPYQKHSGGVPAKGIAKSCAWDGGWELCAGKDHPAAGGNAGLADFKIIHTPSHVTYLEFLPNRMAVFWGLFFTPPIPTPAPL